MGLWKLYWRSLWAYRGAKSVQAEWKAAGKRQAARDAAAKAAKRATAEGATPEEAEQIAEAAARDAVRRHGEIETHCGRRGYQGDQGCNMHGPIFNRKGDQVGHVEGDRAIDRSGQKRWLVDGAKLLDPKTLEVWGISRTLAKSILPKTNRLPATTTQQTAYFSSVRKISSSRLTMLLAIERSCCTPCFT